MVRLNMSNIRKNFFVLVLCTGILWISGSAFAGVTRTKAPLQPILINDVIAAYAREVFASCTDEDMTPAEKVEAAFDYIADRDNFSYDLNRMPYYYEEDWPMIYAEDMRTLGASTCQGMAALFGYVARLCDYSDEIYWCCNPYHAWVEIDGCIYDPVFLESTHQTLVYGWTYAEGTDNDQLGAGYEDLSAYNGTYQYIKVPEF